MTLIVGVSGSRRKNATILTLVKELLKACEKNGALTELIDLAEIDLPMFDNREGWDYGENHKRVQEILGRADGFVFGSPEYHGSMSGSLKNLFDLLQFQKVLAGKPALFCSVGGGKSRGTSMLDHCFVVSRALRMWPVPMPVGLNHSDFDENYKISDEKLLERINNAGQELIRAAAALKK